MKAVSSRLTTLPQAHAALIAVLWAVHQQKRETPYGRADRAAGYANSYTRLPVLLSYRPDAWGGPTEKLDRLEWFRLLGEWWTMCDNISSERSFLRRILSRASREELDAMMTTQERAVLASMPQRFSVYRGCYQVNRPGLSWTTERAVAERFPKMARYRRPGERSILRLGVVLRDRVVLKLDRREQEIIAPYVRMVEEVQL